MPNNKLFVGGLAWATDDASLEAAFSKHGSVTEARVITDRETGRSRGFGFITFENGDDAQTAIQAMDGTNVDGRTIRVNEANERKESNRPPKESGFRHQADDGAGGQRMPRRVPHGTGRGRRLALDEDDHR